MKTMTNPNDIQTTAFKYLYYEDFVSIQAEAATLLLLAEEYKANGEPVNYRLTMSKHKVYQQTLDTLMTLLLKDPVVKA